MSDYVARTKPTRRWGQAAAAHPSYSEFYSTSGYAGFEHETRAVGSLGVQIMQVRQDGHSLTDRATPDLLVGIRSKVSRAPARYHLGDRWIDIPTSRPHTVVAPPLTDVDYQIEGPSELIILAAPADRLASAIDAPSLIDRLAPIYETPFHDPLVEALGSRAWTQAGVGNGLFVDCAALALLSILLTAGDEVRRTTLPAEVPGNHRFSRVVDYIEAHLSQDISLTDLAAVACLSPFHFARAFKARHGLSPVRFVQRRRIERAKHLLVDPDARLIDVAHQCGFADQAHFSTAFRRATGTSPGTWRSVQTR